MGLELADTDEPTADGVSGPVKLVVWDLDDTLWAGTLSEGPVELDPAHGELVRTLNRRGIVNAICSKNEPAAARARLEEAGLWDEFVFARIDWTPKGPRVAQIIEDIQLRAENVLFIDDHPLNRGEVRHFAPGIQTAGPDVLDGLLALPELTGKVDSGRSRLEQYRLLERKVADRQAADVDNDAFLRSCDITVGVFYDTETERDRLYELVHRTHQLNFTKRRPTREQFEAMLADPFHETGYVRVRDRYGSYGVCGFYSRSPDGALEDFLFSCRVLHMGVEQWLYAHLGRPELSVVGDVAATVDGSVDWITLDNDACEVDRRPDLVHGALEPTQPNRVLMIGGCDLTTTAQFIGGRITTDFAHTGPTGAFIHVGHTELLRQSAAGLTDEQRGLVRRIPFVDEGVYASPAIVAPDFDVLVYSVLTDYTQALYRHRRLGLVVPWHQLDMDVTDPARWPALERRFGRESVDQAFLAWFADEFEYLGGISPESFQENLRWLADRIPAGAQVVFLNGAEVPLDNPKEPDRHLRHRTMNTALDEVVASLPDAVVCDVRTFVRTEDDLTDHLRHYRRQAYLQMAEEIRAATTSDLTVEPEGLARRIFDACYKFAGRRRVEVRRLRKRLRTRGR